MPPRSKRTFRDLEANLEGYEDELIEMDWTGEDQFFDPDSEDPLFRRRRELLRNRQVLQDDFHRYTSQHQIAINVRPNPRPVDTNVPAAQSGFIVSNADGTVTFNGNTYADPRSAFAQVSTTNLPAQIQANDNALIANAVAISRENTSAVESSNIGIVVAAEQQELRNRLNEQDLFRQLVLEAENQGRRADQQEDIMDAEMHGINVLSGLAEHDPNDAALEHALSYATIPYLAATRIQPEVAPFNGFDSAVHDRFHSMWKWAESMDGPPNRWNRGFAMRPYITRTSQYSHRPNEEVIKWRKRKNDEKVVRDTRRSQFARHFIDNHGFEDSDDSWDLNNGSQNSYTF